MQEIARKIDDIARKIDEIAQANRDNGLFLPMIFERADNDRG
jgi:hypothetical protein